ncbi:iron chaperone [Pseudopedobacter beijingensis]|uniref:Iron chaperone n=1 Tax=Pseudopedobacter beijingensis TaxID=1207056 RepID=A0ABW4IG81_9SPHI
MKAEYTDVNSYISSFDQDTQQILTKIRNIIKTSAPQAEESISYGMPAYKTFKKPLIYFAAFKSHIGFYATPSGHGHFAKQLSSYKQGKGSVQFPVNQPIPYQLIEEIVLFRVQENKTKYAK